MLNYTREELGNKTATMNQMRNNLYHFLRFLGSKGFNDQEIRVRLERMGKNIAKTIIEEKKFLGCNIEEIVKSVYSELFESKIEFTQNLDQIIIEDKKCSLCKYKREDLSVSPCSVITSLVSEICTCYGYKVRESTVRKSVALGDVTCIHSYILQEYPS